MECDNGSEFMGAIFMCNQTTKQECFSRKLFGLSSAQAKFVKKIKTGIFLFLFEHVERKLYGVFEATSDGAMNIVPNAFSKSGSSFPSQVRFKILWKCQPLTETEFHSAIQDNYFAPYKFNFGLSYEQVGKLIELFSLKKVTPLNHLSHSLHYRTNSKISREQEKKNHNTFKSGFNVKHSMHNQNPDMSFKDLNFSVESKPQRPNMKHSSSRTDYDILESFHISERLPLHHLVPNFDGEQPILGQKLIDIQSPNLRSHSCQPLPESDFYRIPNGYKIMGADEPDPSQRFAATQVPPHSRGPSYFTESYPEAFNLPSTDNYAPIVSISHDELPLPKRSYANYPNHVNYDSTSKFCGSNAGDSFPSMLGQGNCHQYTESYNEVDMAREPRELDNARGLHEVDCGRGPWKSLHYYPDLSLEKNKNWVTDVEPKFSSGYSPELYSVNESKRQGDDYFSQCSKQYPTSASSKIQSDMFRRKTSVFSRLSKTMKNHSQKVSGCYPDPNSLDLLGLLSQRRKQWNNNIERASTKPFTWNSDINSKKSKDLDKMEPISADTLVKLITDSEQSAEDSEELPFINFKRRSEVQITASETGGCDSVKSEKGKGKRRKLLRPSFTENDIFDQSNNECPISESVPINAVNYGNKGTLAPVLGLCDEKHMNPNNDAEGSSNFGMEGGGTVRVSTKLSFGEINGKNVAMVDAKAETFSVVKHGVDRAKTSEEKSHGVGVNEKASDRNPKKRHLDFDLNFEYISTDINCEVSEKNEISRRNPSIVNAEQAVGMGGHAMFHVDHNNTVFCDGNSKKICLEYDAQNDQTNADAESVRTRGEGLALKS